MKGLSCPKVAFLSDWNQQETRLSNGQSWHVLPLEPSVQMGAEIKQSHPEKMRITSVSTENLTHMSTPLKNRPSNAP